MKKARNPSITTALRQKGEVFLKSEPSTKDSQLSEKEMLKVLHELEVHKVELELQNEELSQSRVAARQAADKYTELYDFAPSGYFTLTRDGDIIELNLSGAKLLGKERSLIKNKRLGLFISDDTRSFFNRFLHDVFNSNTLNTCEVTIADNGILYKDVILSGIVTENGEQCLVSVVDISGRMRTFKDLEQSEQKFRDTMTNLDEGYYSVTQEGTLLEHNQAFNRILNYDPSVDLRGLSLPDIWQRPGERKVYLEDIKANGSVSKYQIDIKTRTGEMITVLTSAHLVKDKKDHSQRIEGILLDITERIRTEETLRRLASRLQNLHRMDQAILQSAESPEAIVQTALHHILDMLRCQRTSVGIFDFSQNEVRIFAAVVDGETVVKVDKILTEDFYGDLNLLHQNSMEIVEDWSRVKSTSHLTRILTDEGIQASINVALTSGTELYGALNIGWKSPRAFTPEEPEIAGEVAGQISLAIEHARLLKETKQYAVELEGRVLERTTQLEASIKDLEAFSYSVSHDLRAPLRHIMGYIELLTKSFPVALPEKQKHYLDTITDSALQMGVLIDDLLQFSRTGRQELRKADLDMNVLLQEALQSITPDTKDRSITWTIAPLPHVIGDYMLLQLVWTNLLSNAVKFTQTREIAQIEIGVTENDHEYVFFVRDNGVGFDMHYVNKLFGVFQRLHSAQEFEGTGIGLANVQRIILRHGGQTWARAEINEGALFYFSLPKKNQD